MFQVLITTIAKNEIVGVHSVIATFPNREEADFVVAKINNLHQGKVLLIHALSLYKPSELEPS